MVAKIDRTGEESYNNFGSKMIVVRCDGYSDIDVYFPEYDCVVKNKSYKEFKNKHMKCPYEPRTYGKGYLGEGKYETTENGKKTKYYNMWHDMLRRCYSEEYHRKEPAYIGCECDELFLNFQNFYKWMDDNWYQVPGEMMCLDKDILVHNNKIYSNKTCLIVPKRINSLFVDQKNRRGNEPKGVIYYKRNNKYVAKCCDSSENIYLGIYSTKEEAFYVYKNYKEKLIKKIADKYYSKDLIPKEVYNALYNYEVKITD